MLVSTVQRGTALVLMACLSAWVFARDTNTSVRTVSLQRTANGVAHIEAPDLESLAFGAAWAHAEDNVCQTADHLLTIRGERSRWFGPKETGQLGLTRLPNAQIDLFVRAHMNDTLLEQANRRASADAQAAARGYVAGYNRFLREQAGKLPAACRDKAWVRPMTLTDFYRLSEHTVVQIGIGLMATAVIGAEPPAATKVAAAVPTPTLADASAALAEFGFNEPQIGSNGWAFGADVTTNGRGVLLGNPHFPWYGVNRFWQVHLTIPGKLDVLGASIGHIGLVQIGFNKDVAWTHTVSTGRRFTLFELQLVPGDPTSYLVDGQAEKMTSREISWEVLGSDGTLSTQRKTLWSTRWGPLLVVPRAGLNWSTTTAYAIKDANTGNTRHYDGWLGMNRARSVDDLKVALEGLGIPWVNTIAADRHGNALYADVSVVPDVNAAQLQRCAPGKPAAALFAAAGLVVLNGARADCDWAQDRNSPVPGITPMARMPVLTRRDWVQNSNDSYWLSQPGAPLLGFSPLVGSTNSLLSLRTRAGITEIRERLAAQDGLRSDGKIDPTVVQAMLFGNRNHAARVVLPDLLAACVAKGESLSASSREGCAALKLWDGRANAESRAAPLFREWWRVALAIPNVWRLPFDAADPVNTPRGLNLADSKVETKLWEALDKAVAEVRSLGVSPDSPLGDLQRVMTGKGRIAVHGGPEIEGVLNKIEADRPGTRPEGAAPLPPSARYTPTFGTSYVQTVTFDERGPLAEAILAYGQSSLADSPRAFDQLEYYMQKRFQRLPFHANDVATQRVGEVQKLLVD